MVTCYIKWGTTFWWYSTFNRGTSSLEEWHIFWVHIRTSAPHAPQQTLHSSSQLVFSPGLKVLVFRHVSVTLMEYIWRPFGPRQFRLDRSDRTIQFGQFWLEIQFGPFRRDHSDGTVQMGPFSLDHLDGTVQFGPFWLYCSVWTIQMGLFKLDHSDGNVQFRPFRWDCSVWTILIVLFSLDRSDCTVQFQMGLFKLGHLDWPVQTTELEWDWRVKLIRWASY